MGSSERFQCPGGRGKPSWKWEKKSEGKGRTWKRKIERVTLRIGRRRVVRAIKKSAREEKRGKTKKRVEQTLGF